jgi:hypothetical protein
MNSGRSELRRVPASSAPAPTPPDLAGLCLTSEEVAELTERLLEAGAERRSEPALVPLERYLAIFRSQQVPEDLIRTAVSDLVQRREQRLSSMLRARADELERMLFALLPRLDTSFRAAASTRLPEPVSPQRRPGDVEWVEYRIAAERGELEVRARHLSASGVQHLFTVLVQAARPAGPWRRLLGRRGQLPRRVTVLDPAGLTLEDLLAWTLHRSAPSPVPAAAVAFAFEGLRAAVLGEVDRATEFVRDLSFEDRAAPARHGQR